MRVSTTGFLSALLGATALCSPGASFAQASERMAAAENDTSDIVVTAQRREQRLADIPAAISAFDADALRDANANTLKDVANLISNVQIYDLVGQGNPVWIIRGVGIQDFNTNNTPTAAIYLDDIYQVSSVFGALSLFDIERVEVLKGPQGGLYGRNTTGGAVQVITRAPDLAKVTGQGDASIDNYGRFIGNVSASMPLVTDVLAARISGHLEKSSGGWQRIVATNQRYGALDAFALRGQLLYKSGDLSVRLIGDYGRDKSEIPMPRALAIYSPGIPTAFPAYCPAVLAGRQDDSTCLTFAQATTGGGVDRRDQSVGSAKRVLADPFSKNNTKSIGATLNIGYDLGSATLSSITGYRQFDWRQRQDADATTGEFGHQLSNSLFKSFSQEFRLVSNTDGPVSWLVGASYGWDELNERRPFPSRDHTVFTQGLGLPDPLIFNLEYDQTTNAYAGFGRIDYQASDRLSLFGELRYTKESKKYRNGKVGFLGFTENVHNPALSADYRLGTHWTGKLNARFELTPDNNVYATISRGAKSGGFFGGYAFSAIAVRPYQEEVIWAYEVGSKNVFLDGKLGLNGALFYYDYKDAQGFGTQFEPVLGTVATVLNNIGDARHIGAEIEGFVKPARGLRLSGGIAYLDAELKNTTPFTTQDGQLVSRDGFKRDYAPKWSWNANLSYSMPVGSGEIAVALDANGRSALIRSFGSLVDKAITAVGGYTLVDSRIAYRPQNGSFEIALWAKNLLDKKYKTLWGGDGDGSYFEVFGPPRTYGIQTSIYW